MALKPTRELDTRDLARVGFVISALNERFNFSLPNDGDVIPLTAIGGHFNLHFSIAGDPQFVRAQTSQEGIHAIPPGYRFPWRYNGDVWALHVPELRLEDDLIAGRAHIDRGDPDRDVAGVVTHTFYDVFWGHLSGDLDPR